MLNRLILAIGLLCGKLFVLMFDISIGGELFLYTLIFLLASLSGAMYLEMMKLSHVLVLEYHYPGRDERTKLEQEMQVFEEMGVDSQTFWLID